MAIPFSAFLVNLLAISIPCMAEVYRPDPAECQFVVDAISGILAPYQSPLAQDGLPPLDVNDFFDVLDRLWMEEGYFLDYLYENTEGGGHPVLVARPATMTMEQMATAFLEYYPEEDRESGRLRAEYLEHIITDGSAEAFFQMSVLRIMGFHFDLVWHSNEFDDLVVCTPEAVEDIQLRLETDGRTLPPEVHQQMMEEDLGPAVTFDPETVEVSLLTFTKWGGFERNILVFQREFPHALLSDSSETVAYCILGGRF